MLNIPSGYYMLEQKGQVLLVVILIIVVTSTIGLSVASRSITSLRTSTEEAESQKALSAAEAGIERAIQMNVIPVGINILRGENPSNNSTYSTDIVEIRGGDDFNSFIINGGSTIIDAATRNVVGWIPNTVPKDEGADVWFVDHNVDGTPNYASALSPQFLHLYWGLSSEACGSTLPAAIQAIVISRNRSTGEIRSYRYGYDSCNRGNNFTLSDFGSFTVPGIVGVTYGNRTPEPGGIGHLARGVNDIILVRVIPIYKDTVIGINTCNRAGNNCTSLPSQGYIISSIGKSGAANRKITVFKGYQQTYLPYLSYGLFVAN